MLEPTIIFEDESILLVDKPSGLLVHSNGKNEEATLAHWLLKKYPDIQNVGEDRERPGIVHRIDKETSGILLVARTQQAFVRLKHQFQKHDVHKTYRAFVYDNVKEERGIISRSIGRARGSGSRRSVHNPHGAVREAHTTFHRLAHSASASYIEVFPQTGRTHQIRVHLASINHPVVCDKLYAPGRGAILGFERLALHALSLSFVHPLTNKQVSFEAPLPADFISAQKMLREA